MQLTDILKAECIKNPLTATDKRGAIDELVDLLAAQGRINDPDLMKRAVLSREATRTTGIGHGIAIPHGKCTSADRLVMAIGRPAEPIAFESIDGRPVNIIFLLASPPDQTGPHIQALAKISRLMTGEDFRRQVLECPDGASLFELIRNAESETVS